MTKLDSELHNSADIVDDLRDFSYIIRQTSGIAHVVLLDDSLLNDAADEIQRLRAAGEGIADALRWCGHLNTTQEAALRAWEEARRG